MKIAYFECFAGAGGDMIVGAMLDAGLDGEFLKLQLATLGIDTLDIKISQTQRSGLRAIQFVPVCSAKQHHRYLEDIIEIINRSKINEKAKKTAVAIFSRLAEVEAGIHGRKPNEVHFHEIGAVDSIVDIVSAAIGIEALGVEKVYCSALSVGGGSVKCAHGLLPVPAPATVELLKGVPINGGPGQFELVTPTAAAVLTTIVDRFGPLPSMKIEKTGYGAGTLETKEFANVLRLFLGESVDADAADTDTVCLLETNIDDVSGEIVGYVMARLLEEGALDVFSTPICMKQNRPAVKLSVICETKDVTKLERLLFEEAVTFGIRRQILQRSKLVREFVTVGTKFGEIRIKVGKLNGEVVNAKPEFSDCRLAAGKYDVAVKAVLAAAMAAYSKL
jgi:uncharacterized protein (TIGR00299 family) protein